jgi:hypothetical protein
MQIIIETPYGKIESDKTEEVSQVEAQEAMEGIMGELTYLTVDVNGNKVIIPKGTIDKSIIYILP